MQAHSLVVATTASNGTWPGVTLTMESTLDTMAPGNETSSVGVPDPTLFTPSVTDLHVNHSAMTTGYVTEVAYTDQWNLSLGFNLTSDNFSFQADSSGLEPYSLPGAVLTGLALGFIVLMTIIGNVLVLLAVFVNSHLRGTTHYFIANLALADLLLGTTVLPFSAILEVIQYWAFGPIFCDIWAAVDVLCCTASILSLCVISIDRYIGVTRPLQHSTIMSERRAGYIILSVWLLSTAISVAPLLGWKEPPPDDPRVCEVTMQLGYVLFSVSGSFYIPLAIILVVYFRVYREALNQSRFLSTGVKTCSSRETNSSNEVTLRIHTGTRPSPARPPNTNPQYQSSSSSEHSQESGRKNQSKLTLAGKIAKFNREKKAAKTLGIVVGVFILCWFPFFFFLPLEALCSSCSIPMWLFKIIFWLGYCNSMMNPIIYACSSREFKRAFIRILRCQWKRKRRYFLDETSVTIGTTRASGRMDHRATEMSNMSRLNAKLKKLTRGRSNKRTAGSISKQCKCKDGGASQALLRKAPRSNRAKACHNCLKSRDRESPIASLRMFYNQQRKEAMTMDNIVISDEDSVIHEQSEEESSSSDDEKILATSLPLDARAHAQRNSSVDLPPQAIAMKVLDCGLNANGSRNRTQTSLPQQQLPNANNVRTHAKVHDVPDIVIDEVRPDSCGRNMRDSAFANHTHRLAGRQVQQLYQFDDDNIMWL